MVLYDIHYKYPCQTIKHLIYCYLTNTFRSLDVYFLDTHVCFFDNHIVQAYPKPITTDHSAGTWDRDGNILILTDSALNMPFYGIIQPDGIKSMLLPGLYRGPIVLKRYF